MSLPLPRIAQVLLVVVVAAMGLTWASGPNLVDSPVQGMRVAEGQIAALAAIVAAVLLQIEFKASWIPAGFAAAVVGKELVDLGSVDGVSPGSGLYLSLLAALAATIVLITHMLQRIRNLAAEMNSGNGSDP